MPVKMGKSDRDQYPFQPIKFVNLVVPSPCETEPYNKYHLLTESGVITGKSQTEGARSIHQGRSVGFPCNDRTDKINRLFMRWPF